jgi:hypothetical protein
MQKQQWLGTEGATRQAGDAIVLHQARTALTAAIEGETGPSLEQMPGRGNSSFDGHRAKYHLQRSLGLIGRPLSAQPDALREMATLQQLGRVHSAPETLLLLMTC